MRTLTGLQPSGILHIGNYFGSIKQMIEAQNKEDSFIFIANYHALTSLHNANELKNNTLEAAISFLSLGINPQNCTFWVQSDVKEVLELYWFLSSYTPMGLVERAHSYKDKIQKGIVANHALFSYPVLMAADILLYDSNIVPVGKDQIQHVEIARDIAIKFNNANGEILTIPDYKVEENVATVPGTNGEKMSKSYKNTIDIFATKNELKKQTSSIITDSTPLEEPKEFENCNVYKIAKLFLNDLQIQNLQDRYQKGGEGYGHFKMYLNEVIWDYFEFAREKRKYYLENKNEVLQILHEGSLKAGKIAKENMKKIQDAVGIL